MLIETRVDPALSWQRAGILPTELTLLVGHRVAIWCIEAALRLLVSMLVSTNLWMYDATLSPSGIDSVWRTSVASSDPLGMGRRTDPFGVADRVGGTNPARLCVAVLEHSFRAVALRVLRPSMQYKPTAFGIARARHPRARTELKATCRVMSAKESA
jgi:hypothetical protein